MTALDTPPLCPVKSPPPSRIHHPVPWGWPRTHHPWAAA